MFSNEKYRRKVECINKWALCFLFGDYSSPYEILCSKAGKVKINLNRLRTLCSWLLFIEIYKTNLAFMNGIFELKHNNRPAWKKDKCNYQVLPWKKNPQSFLGKDMAYHITLNHVITIKPLKISLKIWTGLRTNVLFAKNDSFVCRIVELFCNFNCYCTLLNLVPFVQ